MLVNSLNLSNKLYHITVPWTATQNADVLNNGKEKKNDGKVIEQAKFQLICNYYFFLPKEHCFNLPPDIQN